MAHLGAAQSAAPDPMTAEDLERARALLARGPPIVETAPRLSGDGSRVLFLSTKDGAQAFYVKELGKPGPAVRVPGKLPRRVRRPMFSPDGTGVYFTSDESGDEAYAIHRLTLATGRIERVSDDAKLRRTGPWFPKVEPGQPSRMLFTARPMSKSGIHLYEQSGSKPAKLLFQNESLDLAAVRRDGAQILATSTGTADAVHVVDLPSGVTRRLWPRADSVGEVSVYGVAYSPDFKRVYVANDSGGARASVVAIELETGRELLRYVETAAPASAIQELQAGGDRIGFIVDMGIRHDVRILNAATFAPIEISPPLPLGAEVPGASHPNATGGFHLGSGGKQAVVQWSTASSPARVFVINTETGVRRSLLGSPEPPPSFLTSVVEIESFDGLRIPTIVYLPRRDRGRQLPVVVQLHGGFAYSSTVRYDTTLALLLEEGYAVVEPNIRGSGGFGRAFEVADDGLKKLDAVHDITMVGRWITRQSWADPGRLALMGRSAGGYHTLLALEAEQSPWTCGFVAVPMADLEEAIRETDGSLRALWEQKEFLPLTESAKLRELSPLSRVNRIRVPLFVQAGVRDARTPVGQIETFVQTLRERGLVVEYMRSAQGHSLEEPTTRAELMARMLRFFRTRCGPVP